MKTPTPAQQLAITTPGNVLVVAGAGTGKTSTLVERCVRRIIDERCSLDRILMVTFTDAAAAEMRHRIGEVLQKRRATTDEPDLAAHLDEQLALLDTAQICTLSSFCLQLVREHFYELKLDPQIAVLDPAQTEPLMARALDDILEQHYAGDVAENIAVQNLVRTYGGGSDSAVRECVVKVHRYTQTLMNPQRWLAQQIEQCASAEPRAWAEEFCRFFIEWRDFWSSTLATLRTEVPGLDRCLGELGGANCENVTSIAQAIRCLESVLEDSSKKVWAGKKTKVAEIKGFIEDCKALLAVLGREGDAVRAHWNAVRPHLAALLGLVQEFGAKFATSKRDLGGVDFADVEQYVIELLLGASRDQLTPVAQSLRQHFTHVFVDEYQDINEAQDRIIEAVSCSAGNRFLVGDVKQSIYRFRLANPKIFGAYDELWKQTDAAGRSLPLSDNFRSREGILHFVNSFFSALMRPSIGAVTYPAEAHLVFADAASREVLAHAPEQPRVELHLFADGVEESMENEAINGESPAQAELLDLDSTEREARFIAHHFRKLVADKHAIWCRTEQRLRAVKWSDMVVLMRSPSTRVEVFAKEFHRAGVPLRAARAGFYDAAEVRDFINLMRLLDNPLQDIPLVAVLRSPLGGLSDDELAEIRIASPKGPFWRAAHEFRSRGAQRDNESAARAWEKLSTFAAQFDTWRKLIRQSSLSRCLEAALVDTQYEAMLAVDPRGAERIANVLRLIELARAYDPFQRQGLYRFLKFIDAQHDAEIDHEPAAVAAREAVQLMSIHKSKGLEFPVVAVSNLGGRFNERSLNEAILLNESLGLCPKIYPDDADVVYPSVAHWLARRSERRELWGEEMRLLYVALTRARDTLLLVGTAPRKRDGERWESVGAGPVSDWALLSGSCYFDWLRLWLQRNTSAEHWLDERSGRSSLISWSIHSPNDPLLAGEAAARDSASISKTITDVRDASVILERISTMYPYDAATREPAKTSVSALRRRMEEIEDTFPWFKVMEPKRANVSSRELGTAHHTLLELVSLETAGDAAALANELNALVEQGLIRDEHARKVDLNAIAKFWQSGFGAAVRAHSSRVQRELPFTARFTLAELAAVGLSRVADASEFVVLQGVVDLAVLLENEIWILDFKTDAVGGDRLAEKCELYRPQLAVYAHALRRIYRRRVTECRLHFLAAGETLPISVQEI